MAKFTASVPLNIKWNGLDISGAVGATYRIPDAFYEEFIDGPGRHIAGLTWITQDETSGIPTLPLAQTDVTGLTTSLASLSSSLAGKYDKTGGTISGAVTVTGALIAQTSVSTPFLTAALARFKGMPWHDVKAYGAAGDGVTNDLAAFDAVRDAIYPNGGLIYVPEGTYLLGNTWVVDLEEVHIEMHPRAMLITTASTSTGQVLGFSGHRLTVGQNLTSTSPQRTWASIRGGSIKDTYGNQTNNGIGIARFKNVRVENVRFPLVGRKAITAQYGVDNIAFINCSIGTAGLNGITVETECDFVQIVGNEIVESTGGQAISVSPTISDCHIERNVIRYAGGTGINVGSVARAFVIDNSVISATDRGILVDSATDAYIAGNVVTWAGNHGISCVSVAGRLEIVGNNISASAQTSVTAAAYRFDQGTSRPILIGNRINGSGHAFAINVSSMSAFRPITFGNIFTTGTSGVYGGFVPSVAYDLVDGVLNVAQAASVKKHSQGTAAPTSGTWAVGDIVWHTTPAASGNIGWVCTSAGTPGTWKTFGAISA